MSSGFSGFTNNVVSTNTYHAKVHQGIMFTADIFNLALANGGVLELLFQSDARGFHMLYNASIGGDGRLDLFEDTTVSDVGSAVNSINRNRQSEYVGGTVVTSAPTITGDGTPLDTLLIPGGSGGNAAGDSGQVILDWELKANALYLLRLTNISGQANIAHLHCNYYENLSTPIV